ncbi:MAG: aldo/keto reductase [Gammaproteobacteria bacterium]|nr:aldo/keto reductase [Gammaproteobacteria bacterium]
MSHKRKLGVAGPEVTALGLGCMSLSDYYEPRDEIESIALIRHAYDAGVNFFDTAAVYGIGHNEALIGKALREVFVTQRDSVIIATKCGLMPDFNLDLSKESVIASCYASLKKLGLSYIDLLYLHRIPATHKELAQSIEGLIELLDEGVIKYIGLSEADAASIRYTYEYLESKGYARKFIAVQTELSLLTLDVKHNGVLQACKDLGIAFVPYSPLSRALLSPPGKIGKDIPFAEGDARPLFLPRFQGECFIANLAIRDALFEFAQVKGCTLPQLALAWVLAQGEFVIPIPGTRKIKHLEDNLGAMDIELSTAELEILDSIAGSGAKGLRYPEAIMRLNNIHV